MYLLICPTALTNPGEIKSDNLYKAISNHCTNNGENSLTGHRVHNYMIVVAMVHGKVGLSRLNFMYVHVVYPDLRYSRHDILVVQRKELY